MNHINKKFKCNVHQGAELLSDSEDDIPLYEVDLRNPFAEKLTLQEQAKRGGEKRLQAMTLNFQRFSAGWTSLE